jgi:hypothetical protein
MRQCVRRFAQQSHVNILGNMNVSFHVTALSGDQVPRAFPLIQATWPDAQLSAWQSFVEFFNDQAVTKASGVLALHDSSADICGILAYRRDWDLRAGQILAIHLFSAVDLVNSLRTVRALLDVADRRALELGCNAIQIRMHNDQLRLASRLRRLGLTCEFGLFWKKIDAIQAQN